MNIETIQTFLGTTAIDLLIFREFIAPALGITHRFVGTEPNCALTGSYNLAMQKILPTYGIELQIIERRQAQHGVISASRVRELIGRDDFSGLSEYVPPTTLAYLRSDEAAAIRERLRKEFLNKALSAC